MMCRINKYAINFKAKISDNDINNFTYAKQHFSDCYLMSTIETLAQTPNGREILKQHIQYDDNDKKIIHCYLYDSDGNIEKYTTDNNYVIEKYKKVYEKQPNEIIRSLDISVAEYEKKHKSKPWICRFTDNFRSYSFENNLPSLFMKTLTGIQPRVIAETDINLDLRTHKKEVLELFERMSKEKEHSFVISTGLKSFEGHTWHVYIIQNVDFENKRVTIKEKRGNMPQTLTFDEILKNFKFITGYFNNDLTKKEA